MKPFRSAIALVLLLAAAPAFAQQDGKTVYATYCAACHQAAGTGIKGAFPALAGDAFVNGDPNQVIERVLQGHGGMPPFAGQLTDAQIAAAVSYVRSTWGNAAAPVTPAAVAADRAKAP